MDHLLAPLTRADAFATGALLGACIVLAGAIGLWWWAAHLRALEPELEAEPEIAPPPVPEESLATNYRRTAVGLCEALYVTGYAAGYSEASRGRRLSVMHVHTLHANEAPRACRTFADRHGELLARAFVDGANAFERGLRREGSFDQDSLDRAHAIAWHAIARGVGAARDDDEDDDPPGVAS